MQINITIRIPSSSFWLSVLLHTLLLLCCILVITFQPEEQHKTPHLYAPAYVPSYMYTGKVAPPTQTAHTSPKTEDIATVHHSAITDNTADLFSSDHVTQKASNTKNNVSLASIMASTHTVLQNTQREALNAPKDSEPIYLIGDMDGVADPLIKLLGAALSANFSYPKMEGELGIKGRVLIGLTLHPEGYLSHVEIVQSSNNHDLDSAALYAVNKAPAIPTANRFLSEPKHFIIGFLFR